MVKGERYFLGGRDLEMETIAALLGREGRAVEDKGLYWGAKASDYGGAIATSAARGETPVLIELAPDMALPAGTVEIDHHGGWAGGPSALAQVFARLKLPRSRWTRHLALVDANDDGHIDAMRRMGATPGEIDTIRRADRRAQGITAAEEKQGRIALETAERDLGGTLLIVRLPHGRSATVTDPLALAGSASDLLVLMPEETAFFGAGPRIARLDAAFPGGWRGGELPRRGFWGLARPLAAPDALAALGA